MTGSDQPRSGGGRLSGAAPGPGPNDRRGGAGGTLPGAGTSLPDASQSTATAARARTGGGKGAVRRAGRPDSPPSLVNAAIVTTVGTLIWVGLLWLAIAAIFGIVLGIIAVAGSLDSSLWQRGFSGWQRIVGFAAGYTMTSAFGPILIGNGATRSRLAGAASVTMVVLALVGGLFVALGYTLEGLVFSALDWPHELRGGERVDGAGDVVRLGFAHVGLFTCYFAAGRLVGIARGVLGPDEFVVAIPPALIPPAVAELFLIHDLTGLPLIGRVDLDWLPSSWAVGLLVSLAAAVVATVVAHRASRAITLPIGRRRG